MTVLEGESLLNDASALVVLRTSLLAVTAGFSLGDAVADFVRAVVDRTLPPVNAWTGLVAWRRRSIAFGVNSTSGFCGRAHA